MNTMLKLTFTQTLHVNKASRSVHTERQCWHLFASSAFPSNFNIVSIVMLTLTQRTGIEPILCFCVLLPLLLLFPKTQTETLTQSVNGPCEWLKCLFTPSESKTQNRKKIQEQSEEIKERIRFRVRFHSVWIDLSLLKIYCALIKRNWLGNVIVIYISVMVHRHVFAINHNSIDIDQKCKFCS